MGKYDDIINLPHHVSKKHSQMPIADRAAQFAPFAALTGYGEQIKETARTTEEFLSGIRTRKRRDRSEITDITAKPNINIL